MVSSRSLSQISRRARREVDESLVTATAVVFLFSGYESTAVTLSFTCYELARNPHVQKKLQVGGSIERALSIQYFSNVTQLTLLE